MAVIHTRLIFYRVSWDLSTGIFVIFPRSQEREKSSLRKQAVSRKIFKEEEPGIGLKNRDRAFSQYEAFDI